MKITKSILCLWVGSSAFACFTVYGLAYHQGLTAVWKHSTPGALTVPYRFVLADPEVRFFAVALGCAVLAAVSLLVSWRVNKQPVFSPPHTVALIPFVALGFVLLYAKILEVC